MPNDTNQGKSDLDIEKPRLEIPIYDHIFWKPRRYDEMPSELKGFNWGAFFLTFFWGIYHRAYWTLAAPIYHLLCYNLLPIFGVPHEGVPLLHLRYSIIGFSVGVVAMKVVFGFKGNEWAWRSGQYIHAQHFRTMQRVWTIVGLVLNVAGWAVFIARQIFIEWHVDRILSR